MNVTICVLNVVRAFHKNLASGYILSKLINIVRFTNAGIAVTFVVINLNSGIMNGVTKILKELPANCAIRLLGLQIY